MLTTGLIKDSLGKFEPKEEKGDRVGLKFPCRRTALFLEQPKFCNHWTKHLALVKALGSTAKLFPIDPKQKAWFRIYEFKQDLGKPLSLEFELISLILTNSHFMKFCVAVLLMDIFRVHAVSISETQRAF